MNGDRWMNRMKQDKRTGKRMMLRVILTVMVLAACAAVCTSCDKGSANRYGEEKPDKIFLVTDDTPNCSMIISDEIYKYLNEEDDYSYLLDLMNDYFNIVINDEIDPNTVYIKAVSEKIDAEVRLAEVYDVSNKVSFIIQMAEAGRSVFHEHSVNSEESAAETVPKTNNKLVSAVTSSLKKAADKASVYSVKAMKDEFIEKTNQIYSKSEKIISDKNIDELKYSDYYIDIDDDNGISIVCGSQEAVLRALDYFLNEYVQMGTSEQGDYYIHVPDSRLHVGHYLKGSIANKSVSQYSIVYYCDSQYYDSRENAKYLKEYFSKNFGVDLFIKDTDCSGSTIQNRIVIGRTKLPVCESFYGSAPDVMDYQILQQGDDLYILGGSDWAIKYAIDYLIEHFFDKEITVPYSYSQSGSMYGEYVYQKSDESHLRIMSNNVWDYGINNNTWIAKGESSDNRNRFRQMAKVYLAYVPDVLSFQELSPRQYYSNFMLSEINKTGRNYKFVDGVFTFYVERNHTPIIYNEDTLTLIESGAYVFPRGKGQNHDTKSYTWGYFEVKSSGYRFIAFSTHLWWKKDSAQPGSSLLRAEQMTMICNKANELIAKYGCPVFVMGDFNCRSSANEFQTMFRYDFADCHEIATEYSSNSSGRYVCNVNSFSYKPNAGTYKKNSIDHILVKNLKKSRVLTYNYALPNFFGKLSDHAPVYIDVRINQ